MEGGFGDHQGGEDGSPEQGQVPGARPASEGSQRRPEGVQEGGQRRRRGDDDAGDPVQAQGRHRRRAQARRVLRSPEQEQQRRSSLQAPAPQARGQRRARRQARRRQR